MLNQSLEAGTRFGRLHEIAQASPDATVALTAEGTAISAAQLLATAQAVSAQIPARGRRVVLRVSNSVEALGSLHGIWLAGCSVVLVGSTTPPSELTRRVQATGATAIVTPAAGMDPLVERTGLQATQEGEAAIIFTSGTTGIPKAAVISQRALASSAATVLAGLGISKGGREFSVPSRSPQVVFVSMAHMGGLLASQTSWAVGKPLLPVPRFSKALAFDLIERFSLRSLALTPAMVYDLAYAEGEHSLGQVTNVAVGTAPLPEQTRLAFEARYGVPILRNYGQTEFAGAIAFERLDDIQAGRRPPRSVGRIAPGVEVRLVNASGADVAAGEVGEIWAKGGSAMNGYLESSGSSAAESPGWIVTGDLGTLDPDGILTIVGRVRDVLICGGFNIYPAVVEAAINDVPGVVDSAVAGLSDERLGDIPVAVVVSREPSGIDVDTLLVELRDRLSPYELPRRIVCLDSIPRTDTGKVDRRQIAALFG